MVKPEKFSHLHLVLSLYGTFKKRSGISRADKEKKYGISMSLGFWPDFVENTILGNFQG